MFWGESQKSTDFLQTSPKMISKQDQSEHDCLSSTTSNQKAFNLTINIHKYYPIVGSVHKLGCSVLCVAFKPALTGTFIFLSFLHMVAWQPEDTPGSPCFHGTKIK